jgi:hypothetical protein
MRMPRGVPREGDEVTVVEAGSMEPAVVVGVHDGGTRVRVARANGQTAEFRLRKATARFTASDGSRLSWPADSDPAQG